MNNNYGISQVFVTPIHIECKNVSKKFIHHNVIHNASFEAKPGEIISITGPNGSGKSTLIQLISGHTSPDNGTINWIIDHTAIDPQLWYSHLSLAASYIDLIDEYTVEEMIAFHFGFKKTIQRVALNDVSHIALLSTHTHKRVKTLSSGMKQRLKLTLALLSHTSIVLIDEPTTNLDTEGKAWFAHLLSTYATGRVIFIATNDNFDIQLCHRTIDVMAFKQP